MKSRDIPFQTKRFYKIKKPKKSFLCALCTAPRSIKYNKRLSFFNYFQILLIATVVIGLAYPVIGAKSFFSVFLLWSAFEITNKLLYRKEIPCPYCGFDATWYRRDVKIANQMVKDFWAKNYPELAAPKVNENILNADTTVSVDSVSPQTSENSEPIQEAHSH